MSVSTNPGARAVTWMPLSPTSFCVDWLNPITAAFVAE
jgi:hypothetical protein